EIPFRKLIQQSSDQGIDVADAGVISVPQLTDLVCGKLPILGNVGVAFQFFPTACCQLGSALRMFSIDRQRDLIGVVQIPVLPGSTKWQMRFAKTHSEKERLLALLQLANRPNRCIADDAVEIRVVRNV